MAPRGMGRGGRDRPSRGRGHGRQAASAKQRDASVLEETELALHALAVSGEAESDTGDRSARCAEGAVGGAAAVAPACSDDDDGAEEGATGDYAGPPLGMWELRQTDARRDTGSRLKRHGLVSELRLSQRWRGLVLSSNGLRTISAEDARIVSSGGIACINCSWARVDGDVPFAKMKSAGGERLLPFLLAANPTKYGQPFVLSSAEALAAGLFITGYAPAARNVMRRFKWGDSFWALNGEVLERYARCATAEEVIAVQDEVMANLRREREERTQDAAASAGDIYGGMPLPPSESEEEDERGGVEEEEFEEAEGAGGGGGGCRGQVCTGAASSAGRGGLHKASSCPADEEFDCGS